MEQIIRISDVAAAIDEAYRKFRHDKEGTVDSRDSDVGPDKFAISVALADGTVFSHGDTEARFALGDIAQIPVAALLMQGNTLEQLYKKSGAACGCRSDGTCDPEAHHQLAELPFSRRLMRAVAAIEPTDDLDGKMDVIIGGITSMMGDAPVFDDKLYKAFAADFVTAEVAGVITRSGFYVSDDVMTVLDVVARLYSLRVDSRQLAMLGATLAAGGICPVTSEPVLDAAVCERVVAAMASFGPGRNSHGWLIGSGVPAMSCPSGAMLGVVPGVMSLAACSPRLNARGFSQRGSHAIRCIASRLRVNAFSGASVKFEP